jgi:hypothetical protein
LDLADQLCFDGREKMPLDREIAVTYLKEAQQTYAEVLHDPKARPEMIRRAALAEPKCWELMGDRERAIASYKEVADRYRTILPEVCADAAKRAEELEQPEAADFYKWLAEYKPSPAPPYNIPGLSPTFPPLNDEKESGSAAPTLAPDGTDRLPSDPDTKEPSSETTPPSDPPVSATTPGESSNDGQPAEKPQDEPN